jgi:hypothetical protein
METVIVPATSARFMTGERDTQEGKSCDTTQNEAIRNWQIESFRTVLSRRAYLETF